MNVPVTTSGSYARRPYCHGCGSFVDEGCMPDCPTKPPVPQSKGSSLAEAVVNTVVGYGLALIGQIVVFPIYGCILSLDANIAIGVIFMGISTVRCYTIRRVMEWLRVRGIMR